jgi:hypothetical protein
MSKVSYTLVGPRGSIYLSYEGNHVTLGSDHKFYSEIRELIKQKRQDEIPDVLNRQPVPLTEYIQGSGLHLVNGQLQDSEGNDLPAVLSQRLVDLNEEGFPVGSLVTFWNNLKENPSSNSREQLFKFLEQNGHPLTDDGHFIAYRGVTSDFKDVYSKTFDNSPGSVCEMPRAKVDDNPNRTCSRGLHVAAYEYASTFGPVTVEVKVNPADVVAVPTDYNGQKMRVCKFVVVQECKSKNSNASYTTRANCTWDKYEEDELEEETIDYILELAGMYGDRYKDRASLASRIEEEVLDLDVGTILKVLNEHLVD